MTHKIQRILAHKRQLERLDLSRDLRRADDYVAELERSRDLTQIVVHIDCDAFYAAVEELDRPELKHVPMAVGKGVLTTCNYHARKFGCRSGMAGFVAKKLCPQLICLPLNFEKYTKKAKEVREVLAEYDPRFESASIDEAYLNITKVALLVYFLALPLLMHLQYCDDHNVDPESVISMLRQEVSERTKITISAGIGPNAKVAKIASNKNKPNGQFMLRSSRDAVMAFMKDLPVRKVNGVGRVFDRELGAIGIKTCGDIFDLRAYLATLFGEKAFQFLARCYLGIGRTRIQPADDYERKSVGTESTFGDLSGLDALKARLRRTAEELSKDLDRTQFKGRTLVLKIKLHTYEVHTRQVVVPKALHLADDIYSHAIPMLSKLDKEMPGMKLRLMGLRMTNLVSTKKHDLDFFGLRSASPGGVGGKRKASQIDDDGTEWEAWPDEEGLHIAPMEEPAGQEADEIDPHVREPLEARPQDDQDGKQGRETTLSPKKKSMPEPDRWDCPICMRPQAADDKLFNDHIDFCLSRQTIREAVESSASPAPASAAASESKRGLVLGKQSPFKPPSLQPGR